MTLSPKLKIGVFDSGIIGLSVATAIKEALPDHEIIYREDQIHFPYDLRPPSQLMRYVEPILWSMVREGCNVIVIADTSVVTTIMGKLQKNFAIPLVGVEPMLQEAASLTKTGTIAVCATMTTLKSNEYRLLKEAYAHDVNVLEPESRDWPYMEKHDLVDDLKVGDRIKGAMSHGADVIVLAGTPYKWIEDKIKFLAVNKAIVLQPEDSAVSRLQRVLNELEA